MMPAVETQLLIWILLFPLCGAVLCYPAGAVNKGLPGWIAVSAAVASFTAVIAAMSALPPGAALEQQLFTWLAVDAFSVPFLLRFDRLTAVMGLVVSGVGALIHLYAVGYMAADKSRPRFFAYFNLFLFCMLLLVLGGNLLVLFAGWEGVGLCSYLLIGFWHEDIAKAAAGRKAFVVNRIGDAGFLAGVFLLLQHFGTLDFAQLQSGFSGDRTLLDLIAFCFFLGAAGKSAQIPLFVWLPDAMAGPTPVSALIHAATMVTAGVYLMARMHFLFSAAPGCMIIIVVIALLTALMAAVIALMQNDIKKVLAYSTISQLGFMFMAAGVGAYGAAIFHLVTHSFFKACLFLGAGSVISGAHHEQDMRRLGGLARLMPWTFAAYLISALSIAGIFPLAGYQSKHAIMEALSRSGDYGAGILPSALSWLVPVVSVLTAFYITRSLMLTFGGTYHGDHKPHEARAVMVCPLTALAVLSAAGGMVLGRILPDYLSDVLPVGVWRGASESALAGVLHSWAGIAGVLAGYLCYGRCREWPAKICSMLPRLSRTVEGRFFVDELYAMAIVRPLEGAARALGKFVDQGLIDGALNGAAWSAGVCAGALRHVQTGRINHYALFIFAAVVVITVIGFGR